MLLSSLKFDVRSMAEWEEEGDRTQTQPRTAEYTKKQFDQFVKQSCYIQRTIIASVISLFSSLIVCRLIGAILGRLFQPDHVAWVDDARRIVQDMFQPLNKTWSSLREMLALQGCVMFPSYYLYRVRNLFRPLSGFRDRKVEST